MANTLAKALGKRYDRRWQFVDFLGPKRAESAGIVDIIAIKKDGRKPAISGLKPLDLLNVVLIQVKGGSAKSPTAEDVQRMKIVGHQYGAENLVLFEWTKQKKAGWSVLDSDGHWKPTSPSAIFGAKRYG